MAYFSSVEGIRSAGPGVRMAGATARFRAALVGDSNAFSFEVPFEESWGYHLQELLGAEAQVLNFGVDGYGIRCTSVTEGTSGTGNRRWSRSAS
jgi:hypothetical protein